MTEENEPIEKSELLNQIKNLASILLSESKVIKRVGLMGSLARNMDNENDFNDIDLVYFVDDKIALDYATDSADCDDDDISPKYREWAEKSDREPKDMINYEIYFMNEILKLSSDDSLRYIYCKLMIQKATGKPIQEITLSNEPSERYIYAESYIQHDPTFLENVMTDALIFDPEKNEFVKTEVYNEAVGEVIKRESFYRIKELQDGSNVSESILDHMEQNSRYKADEEPSEPSGPRVS